MTSPPPDGPPSLLATTAVAKSFGTVVALRSVDLAVAAGQVHALLGANGAGKSTLVKILTGVLRADAGTVAVAGRPVDLRRPSDAHRFGLAPVFQDPALVPDLTVAQNLRLTGADVDAVRARSRRWTSTASTSASRFATCRCRSCACSTSPGRCRATPSCCSSTRSPPPCRPTCRSGCSR